MESNLWKSSAAAAAAAVWTVYDQWMASSLLQHVRADLEPARIRNGVSLFCAHFSSCKRPSSSLCSHLTALDVCVLRQSQSSGWMGGFGSQSAQAAAPQGPVMSNLGNYNMAGYQTQWAKCETKGIFLLFLFFFKKILVNCFGTKRQRPYSQSLCNGWLLFNNRFIFTVVGRSLAQNFVIPYTTMLIHSRVKWKCSWAHLKPK